MPDVPSFRPQIAQSEARRADGNAGLINGALGRLVERDRAGPTDSRPRGLTAFRSELLRDAVDMYDELVRRNPGEGTLGLGEALNNQTLLLYLLGEIPQALESARRAEAVLAALPPSYESRRALANARKQLGVVGNAAGEPAEGLKKTQDAVTLYQALLREKPGDQDVRFQLVLATVNLGNFAMQQGIRTSRSPATGRPSHSCAAPQGGPFQPALCRVGSPHQEQSRADPGGNQEDRGGDRISARGGRRGRASLRRFPPTRCPGDLPQ